MMEAVSFSKVPRYVYDPRYIEPEIQILVLERDEREQSTDIAQVRGLNRYRPTGTRTSAGLYEYELAEECPLL